MALSNGMALIIFSAAAYGVPVGSAWLKISKGEPTSFSVNPKEVSKPMPKSKKNSKAKDTVKTNGEQPPNPEGRPLVRAIRVLCGAPHNILMALMIGRFSALADCSPLVLVSFLTFLLFGTLMNLLWFAVEFVTPPLQIFDQALPAGTPEAATKKIIKTIPPDRAIGINLDRVFAPKNGPFGF